MHTFNQKGFTPILLVVVVAFVVVGGFVAWRVYNFPGQQTQGTQPKTQPTDPNAGYVVIKEWGVRFKPVEGLSGVEYFKPKGMNSDVVSITTHELATKEPRCGEAGGSAPIGLLQRSKTEDEWAGGVITQIGGYYYQYRGAGAACSENDANIPLENVVITQIAQSVDSLEAAK